MLSVNAPVLPVACNDYAAPSAPSLLEPRDGTVLFRNCEQTPIGFVWSAGTGEAETWQMRVEVFRDSTWLEVAGLMDLIAPRTSVDVPCASSLRWQAAGVSVGGWLGALSAPASLLIAPTDIPVLAHPSIASSCAPATLTWSVGRTDGIAAYEIQIVDHKTGTTTSETATQPSLDFRPTSCDAEYDVDGLVHRCRRRPW